MPRISKASREKGQMSITSFFAKSKRSGESNITEGDIPANLGPSDDGPAADAADSSSGQGDAERDGDGEATKGSAIENSDLPPIHHIPSIFSDLVSRIPQIKGVVNHLAGRKLRVATMCSGTESPLLALNLVRRCILEHFRATFDYEHVFSCEIEPFKQAYIERNFQPPILFRDVCELHRDEATTAYGALVRVPGDVDLLIAGTSCVDYSNLNNEKQGIDANGESGRTFHGMMSWVQNHRPPLIILENVCSAPWDDMVEYFTKKGYSAAWIQLDTKSYYIPHTRNRKYLLAVDKAHSAIPGSWKAEIQKLERPASSTLDAFLLPTDDPRIHQARQKLANKANDAEGRARGRTDWGRCESRHQRARLEEQLGTKRPLTSWEEGGRCKLPDFAWNDWGIAQVERVWDLMDISLLRSAVKGVDPSFKTQVWNLSQNVDRSTGSSKPGVSPCLTPSMIPYVTNRGGPMIGLEALSMQGLPVDELQLTRETEDQLADLAGNAMSTTVVGTCMLAALVAGRELLKKGSESRTYREVREDRMVEDGGPSQKDENEDMTMEVDPPVDDVGAHITGEDQLAQRPLNLAASATGLSLAALLEEARRSARLCICEGRKGITDRTLNRCVDCDSTSCVKCGGRPEHNYEPLPLQARPRLLPSAFEKDLKAILPMSLSVSNVTEQGINVAAPAALGVDTSTRRFMDWRVAVLRSTAKELRFVEAKRQETWSVVYESPSARLELSLHPQQPQWRLFALPEDSAPANAEIRRVLELPVGRFVCTTGLFDGRWEWALPNVAKVDIEIEGDEEPVPAWEHKLGLQGDDFKARKVHAQLVVRVPAGAQALFDRDVFGTYALIDKCGTANAALHKRAPKEGDRNLPPVFLLLDPTRCGEPSGDAFVFSTSTRRYEYGESRPIIATLEPKWRQSDVVGVQHVQCIVPCQWVEAADVKLAPGACLNAVFATPAEDISINVSQDACKSASALLVCKVPLGAEAGPEWSKLVYKDVDRVHERSTFHALAWITERIRNVDGQFTDWHEVETHDDHAQDKGTVFACHRCAPVSPAIRWAKGKRGKIAAVEDTVQAGEFERSLKRRPAPFVTQLKVDADGFGIVRIGVNLLSLMHRALSRLPTLGRTESPTLAWRLNTDFTPVVKVTLPKFQMASNRLDREHTQPPSFALPLRPEQLRSLTWMLEQEKKTAPPFIEEEISEAILEPLGWRAEGRAQRAYRVRGGVLADQVGYGKTAISLGLIDCTADDVEREIKESARVEGHISTKATLIIVPPHLTLQWESEVRKFTQARFKVVTLHTASNLNSLKIQHVVDADIVIVASNLFRSRVYLDNLEAIAGAGELPAQDGRFFDARLGITLEGLQKQVERLRDPDQGAKAVMHQILEGRKIDEDAQLFVQTKRLKGKSYRDATDEANVSSNKGAKAGKKDKESAVGPAKSESVSPKRRTSALPPSKTKRDEDPDPPPSHSAMKRKAVVLSDDEQSKSSLSKKGKAPAKKRPAKRSKVSSNDRGGYAGPPSNESGSEEGSNDGASEESGIDSDEDERPKKGKGKAKAAPKKRASAKKPRPAASTTSESEDGMDVDDTEDESTPSGTKQTAKERKTGDKPPKEKKRREDSDPWKLKSQSVQSYWMKMQAPPLEMFHFARKIVDEYTYLDGKVLSMVTRVKAERHWVLSGTPPIHDFGALKTISAFLNIHLGIDDDNEGQSQQVKKRKREQTAVEKFHSFREVHSLEWHAHRHQLGQRFLDQFVRQNVAEIDEISWGEEIRTVTLPAAERAIYLELEHYLRAIDMTVKRGRKSESDREKRLAQALGDSSTAEEALLKRCSHFELETADKENAMKACEIIVKERKRQLEECKKELLKKLNEAVKMEKEIGMTSAESNFREYVRVTRTEGVGDKEATGTAQGLLGEAGVARTLKPATNKISDKLKRGAKKDDSDVPKAIKDLMWEHREQTHQIRRLTKELVGRVRSLRYFTVVRDVQKRAGTRPAVHCPRCERRGVPVEEIAVLSSCGHTGCYNCVMACAEREDCVYAASGACRAAARVLNVVKGDTLGVDDEARDGRGKHYGRKLEEVIKLIKNTIPEDERILIFAQFPDLTAKVAEALTAHKIAFLEIKGSASKKSKNLEKFQNDSKERVLLLNVMDESASGANLTSANHVIFLSPLLTQTQEIYEACETQAIGRVRRYGQLKHVNIWRFFSLNTIDVEIYEQRTGQKLE